MFMAVLIAHIFGALLMALFSIGALLGVGRNALPQMRRHSLFLAWGLGFELTSGSLLALLSPNAVSFGHFCQNVALYLFATGAVFLVVSLRTSGAFSRGAVLVPVLPSVFFTVLTAASLW